MLGAARGVLGLDVLPGWHIFHLLILMWTLAHNIFPCEALLYFHYQKVEIKGNQKSRTDVCSLSVWASLHNPKVPFARLVLQWCLLVQTGQQLPAMGVGTAHV